MIRMQRHATKCNLIATSGGYRIVRCTICTKTHHFRAVLDWCTAPWRASLPRRREGRKRPMNRAAKLSPSTPFDEAHDRLLGTGGARALQNVTVLHLFARNKCNINDQIAT